MTETTKLKEELLGFDLATKDGDKSTYVYGYRVNGMTFITKIESVTTPQND